MGGEIKKKEGSYSCKALVSKNGDLRSQVLSLTLSASKSKPSSLRGLISAFVDGG